MKPFRLIVFLLAFIINIGMWLERFIIVITSLQWDYMPSAWGMYYPTIWDWAVFVGTIGFFLFMMFLFIRFIPMIAISEVQALLNRYLHHAPEATPDSRDGVAQEPAHAMAEKG